MPFNGSGVFNRLYTWANDAAAGIKIRADRFDNEMNGMAIGLSQCITKDGQTTVTANLPMAGFKHTGVGNAAARAEYASFAQLSDGKGLPTVGGTANAITLAFSIPHTSYVNGMEIFFVTTATNTSTVTVNVDGLGAKDLRNLNGAALASGDLGSSTGVLAKYDGTNFRISGLTAIADNAVTTGKLADLAVSTAKLADNAVTNAKLADMAANTAKVRADAASGDPSDVPIGLNQVLGRGSSGNVRAVDFSEVSAILGNANVATTSGTTIDLSTSIPANVRRINIAFDQVSTNGTDNWLLQLGDSGGYETSGYLGSAGSVETSSSAFSNFTTGFGIRSGLATNVLSGIITLIRTTGNTWIAQGAMGSSAAGIVFYTTGTKTLSDVLTSARLTTTGGTNTWDSGSVTLTWEF